MIVDRKVLGDELRSVLIYKVVPVEAFFDFTERLSAAYPGVRITVLANTSDQDEIDRYRTETYHPEIEDVVYISDRRSLRRVVTTLARQLRRRRKIKHMLVPLGTKSTPEGGTQLYLPFRMPIRNKYFITSSGSYLPIDFFGIIEMLRKMLRSRGFWNHLWSKVSFKLQLGYCGGLPTTISFQTQALGLEDHNFIVDSLNYPLNNIVYTESPCQNTALSQMARHTKSHEIACRIHLTAVEMTGFDPKTLMSYAPERLEISFENYTDTPESQDLLSHILAHIASIHIQKERLSVLYPRISLFISGLSESAVSETRNYLTKYQTELLTVPSLANSVPKAQDVGGAFCAYPWFSVTIAADGRVWPCPYLVGTDSIMGNIFDDDIAIIWNANAYRAFRQHYWEDPHSRCTECSKNKPELPLL